MIKKISLFIVVIAFSVIFNLLTQSSSEAAAVGCTKNSDGTAILVTPGVKPFTLAGTSTTVDQCSQEPDQYKIKFYKAALCSDDPYKGSADPSFESCIDILSSEKEVILEPGVDTNLLDGEDLVLPIGSYTYFTVIVHNHLNLKHKQKYVLASDPTSAANIFGNTSGNGAWCWSKAAVTTYANRIADGSAGNYAASYNTAHGVTLVASGTGTTNARLECGSDEPSASDIGWATEIIDDLADDPDNEPFSADTGGYFSVESDTGLIGLEMAGALLKTDNTSIAANANEARRINGTFKYSSPIIISENTTSFKLFITTYSSVSIDMAIDTGDDNKIWAAKMGADPFTIQVKTKTKRRRGAWR